MKKQNVSISNPDEFNKRLQHTSPGTWIILGAVVAILVAFFVWACTFTLVDKVTGLANIVGGQVALQLRSEDLDRLMVGQKVYIEDKEGEILSVTDETATVTTFELSDGEYNYTIIVREMKPIDFLIGK